MNVTGRKAISILCLAGFLAMIATACGGGMPNQMEAQMEEQSVLTVQIEKPEYGSIYLSTDMVGTIEPEYTATVYPKSSGTVTAVYFEVGDTVKEGQVLATLDSSGVTSARISVDTAQLNLETAQKDLERKQVLYENDGITSQALETAENSVKSAQLQLESAQDNYETQLEYANIISPITGVVESRDIEVYDNASMQQAVCVISQKEKMQVVFQVSERVKNAIALGDSITVEKNGIQYQATITEISSKTVDGSGLFEVEAFVEGGTSLSNGSKVTVTLVTNKSENVLCIPLDAIYYDNGNPYVFVSENGIAEIVYVETGIYDEDRIEIISGLTIDTQVITSWSSQLTSGKAVQSIEDIQLERTEGEDEV